MQILATNVPMGCRSQNEYERRLFRAGSGMKNGILFGPHDPQGVIPSPSYVNADLMIDGVLMVHESVDMTEVQKRWVNRHEGRTAKTNWPTHWWRRQGPLP